MAQARVGRPKNIGIPLAGAFEKSELQIAAITNHLLIQNQNLPILGALNPELNQNLIIKSYHGRSRQARSLRLLRIVFSATRARPQHRPHGIGIMTCDPDRALPRHGAAGTFEIDVETTTMTAGTITFAHGTTEGTIT